MARRKITDANELKTLFRTAEQKHRDSILHMEDMEQWYKGEGAMVQDLADADIEIVRSARARNIVHKFVSMLAIRGQRTFHVPQLKDLKTEEARSEAAEKFLSAYYDDLVSVKNADPLKDMATLWALRGRSALKVVYVPHDNGGYVDMIPLDGMQYYPMYTATGRRLSWVVEEYWRPRIELMDYFDELDPDEVDFEIPNLMRERWDPSLEDFRIPSYEDEVRVIEYWDSQYHYILIEDDGDTIIEEEHGYGFVPIAEARMNETPLKEARYQSDGLIGPVLDALKNDEKLMGKLATAVEQFYYPRIFMQDEDGNAQIIDSFYPGGYGTMKDGTRPVTLNPTPNNDVIAFLQNRLNDEIEQATIPGVVYSQDIPNTSGFLVSQILSLVKDSLADHQYALERAWSAAFGMVMRLHEIHADDQPDGVWMMPIRHMPHTRPVHTAYTGEAFRDLYRVQVHITAALPQDRLQQVTMFNQLYQIDATGKPRFSRREALKLAGLDEEVNLGLMEDELNWEWALLNDQELQALHLEQIKARRFEQLKQMRKDAAMAGRKMETLDRNMSQKDADRNLQQPVTLTPEQMSDPELLQQLAELARQGQDPRTVLNGDPISTMSSGTPTNASEVEDLVAMLGGDDPTAPPAAEETMQAGLDSPTIDGLTGFQGLDPRALSNAAAGGLPRQQVDQPNVAVEQMEQQNRRGALPPPK